MNARTKARIQRILYPLTGVLIGVAEAVQGSGNVYEMSWQEILNRAARSLPFAVMGFIARSQLLREPPPEIAKDGQKE